MKTVKAIQTIITIAMSIFFVAYFIKACQICLPHLF